jgi:hypothetical protein
MVEMRKKYERKIKKESKNQKLRKKRELKENGGR